MENFEIAKIIGDMSKMMFIQDYDPELIKKYSYASKYLCSLSELLFDMFTRDRFDGLTDISDEVKQTVAELCTTGEIEQYLLLKASVPEGLLDMLSIPGVDKEIIKLIYNQLNIDDVSALNRAAYNGELHSIDMIDRDLEHSIIEGIKILKSEQRVRPIDFVLETAQDVVLYLKKNTHVADVQIVGALRRRVDFLDTIELMASTDVPAEVLTYFCESSLVREHRMKSDFVCEGVTKNNLNVLLYIVPKDRFVSALVKYTGSEEFLDEFYGKIQQLHGIDFKVDEHGILKNFTKESDVFKYSNMQAIPPVLREGRGEVVEAIDGSLPNLVSLGEIRGDLHVHSTCSDGKNSIVLLVERAIKLGYEYIGIADHSQSLTVANGVTVSRLKEKIKKIKKLNKEYDNISILCGTEVDILSDGTLDYSDKVLDMLDYVIGSVHVDLKMSYDEMTRRILKAVTSGKINILGHPTGRLFGVRKAFEFDLDQVMQACADYDVAMEISAYTNRLDLNDVNAIKAKEKGVKFAIGTDSHYIDNLESMRYGVWTAQRAWLCADDIINTKSLDEMFKK